MQKKIINQKTNDEKVQEILLKTIDKQIDSWVNRIESLKRNIKEFEMEVNQLKFQKKKIIKDGWK